MFAATYVTRSNTKNIAVTQKSNNKKTKPIKKWAMTSIHNFQKRVENGQQLHEKLLNSTSNQGNTNHNEIPFNSCEDGYYLQQREREGMVRIGGDRHTHILLLVVYIAAVSVENNKMISEQEE